MNKTVYLAMAMTLLMISSTAMAVPYDVNVRFWLDTEMNDPYINGVMKVYFQNQTYVSGYDYEYTCYHANYVNGTASFVINETQAWDLLITDGNVVYSNSTGCPITIENYGFWSTVQSNMLIDQSGTYDYWINITIEGEPRNYFWGTQSIKSMISAGWWIVTFLIVIGVEYWLVKQGSNPSVILPIVLLIISILIKLSIGI